MAVAEFAVIVTPIGAIRVTGNSMRLLRVSIDPVDGNKQDATTPLLRDAIRQIERYFEGRLEAFDLPLAPASTRRGDELRAALVAIPFGETRSYGALAATHASGSRAIGMACRTNPFPIIVPCHRVVSAGKTEYYSAGAGPSTKAWLLEHERHWRA